LWLSECNNPDKTYAFFDAERNDIWALGIIFACIIGGRMPWHIATEEDVDYIRHLRHAHYLRQVLPISKEANFILQRIFHPCTENAPSLDDIREMVLRVGTFFMGDKEIKRSKRLTYISDEFTAMQHYMAALEANSTSLSAIPRHKEIRYREGPLNSQSLCAMEEGNFLSRHGTPEARHFVFGMVLAGSAPRSSVVETPLVSVIMDHSAYPAPPQAPLSVPPETESPQRNASSTLIASKDEYHNVRKGGAQKEHSWLTLPRSVRRLFAA
jgi:serine/threonine protein kinase